MWALRFLGVGVYMSIPSLLSRHHTTRASNNLLLLYMFHILKQTTNKLLKPLRQSDHLIYFLNRATILTWLD